MNPCQCKAWHLPAVYPFFFLLPNAARKPFLLDRNLCRRLLPAIGVRALEVLVLVLQYILHPPFTKGRRRIKMQPSFRRAVALCVTAWLPQEVKNLELLSPHLFRLPSEHTNKTQNNLPSERKTKRTNQHPSEHNNKNHENNKPAFVCAVVCFCVCFCVYACLCAAASSAPPPQHLNNIQTCIFCASVACFFVCVCLCLCAAVDAARDKQPAGVGPHPGGARAGKDCPRESQQLLKTRGRWGGRGNGGRQFLPGTNSFCRE